MKAKRVADPPIASGGDRRADDAHGVTPAAVVAQRTAVYGATIASGLLGGIVGAGLMFFALQGIGSGNQSDQRVENRVAALDQKVGGLAPRDSVAALDKRLAASEQTLKSLPDAVKSASDRADEALKKAQGIAAGPASGDLEGRLAALDKRVSALQASEPVSEGPSEDETARLADLEARLAAIEASKETEPTNSGSALAEKLAALETETAARVKQNETADQGIAQRLDQLQQALDAKVKTATDAVSAASDASAKAVQASKTQAEDASKALDKRIQEQSDRLASLDKSVAGSAKATTVQAALRAIAADRLAGALDSGLPYAPALSSLRDMGVDAKQIAPLAPFAESGAPTAASLAAAFRPVAEGIAAARQAAKSRAAAETGSVSDKLMTMAGSLVSVKRVGTSPTPSAGAASTDPGEDAAAKVQAALDQGKIAEAAQLFATLPEDLRGQASVFGSKLKARAEAALAAKAIQTDAFQSVSTPAGNR